MRTVSVLGATGSIGRQALDVIARYPDRFRVAALVAHTSAARLFDLARAFRPQLAALAKEPPAIPDDLKDIEWIFGPDCAERAAALPVDDVLTAVVGIAGLPAALAALKNADRLLLANKEALVAGGELVMARARALGRAIIPVDSEHSAVYQCLRGADGNPARRIILTASGGPFRTWDKGAIQNAQKHDALAHPTWQMGAKITVDCASMMNKGLEVIEAHHLFGLPLDKISVVVHPESIVHSMVEFADGALMAQLGTPDMRGPISYALGCPERLPYGGQRLDFASAMALRFEPPDVDKFPCLNLAFEAQRAGGVMPVALNAANEVAVGAFLSGRMRFGGIAAIVDATLSATAPSPIASAEDIYAADRAARDKAEHFVRQMNG